VITVVVADDEEMIRSAIVSLLGMEEGLVVVAEAANGTDAVALARRHRPDVVLLDLEMPPTDGLDTAAEILAGVDCRAVLMTRHARPGILRRALATGVQGFVPKSSPVSTLARAIRDVAAGQRYIDGEIAAAALSTESCPLTDRELDVLRLTRQNAAVADIARALHLAEGTVRNYLSAAMTKTDTTSRHAAATAAWENGWI
jgi:two-component system response regulator DesR